MTEEQYNKWLAEKKRADPRFDASALDKRFVPYFRSSQRIRIESYGMIVTGTVGVTTGWKPAFLLMRTVRSSGSSWVLGAADKIIAVQQGKKYHPTTA